VAKAPVVLLSKVGAKERKKTIGGNPERFGQDALEDGGEKQGKEIATRQSNKRKGRSVPFHNGGFFHRKKKESKNLGRSSTAGSDSPGLVTVRGRIVGQGVGDWWW